MCLYCATQFQPVLETQRCCSPECHVKYARELFLVRWKLGLEDGKCGQGISKIIRIYLFEKYCNKCSRCGWSEVNKATGLIPLTVEHIDGDSTNNREENLDLICPNCHSLTPTYGSLNRGNGRKNRHKKRECDVIKHASLPTMASG